jgi:hypothetical protein
MCTSLGVSVANAYFQNPLEKQVTFYNIGSSPHSELNHTNFGQLDLILVPKDAIGNVKRLASDRDAALSSHHFLVECSFKCDVDKQCPKKVITLHRTALKHPYTTRNFQQVFDGEVRRLIEQRATDEIDAYNTIINEAFVTAAKATIPAVTVQPKRPWIRAGTLRIIEQRNEARAATDFATRGF